MNRSSSSAWAGVSLDSPPPTVHLRVEPFITERRFLLLQTALKIDKTLLCLLLELGIKLIPFDEPILIFIEESTPYERSRSLVNVSVKIPPTAELFGQAACPGQEAVMSTTPRCCKNRHPATAHRRRGQGRGWRRAAGPHQHEAFG